MTCPTTSPSGDAYCGLEDTADAHVHGHSAPTPGGDGVTIWGVTTQDHERWDTTPPEQLLVWEADARAAEETPTEPELVEATE